LSLVLLGASLINPWGIHAFDLARLVAGRITPGPANLFSREIPENLPLLDWLREDPARGLPWAWALLGTLALWRRGEGALGRALLLTGSVALAFMAVRNLPLAALAMLFSVAPSKWRSGTVPFVLSFLLAAGLAVPLLRERRWDLPGSWSAPFGTPSDSALEAIAKIPGPVFHELRVGGWLSWKLENRKACWADTRLVLHDAAFVHAYLDVLDNPEHFEAWSRLQGFQAALLPVASWPRDRGLVATLLSSPDWKLVECDGAWILFARRETDFASLDVGTAGGRAVIDLALHDRFASNPRLEAFARTQWNQTLRLAGLSR